MSPGSTLVPAGSLAMVRSRSFLPRDSVLRNWVSSSLMTSLMVCGSFLTSGKASPRILTTVSTRLAKKPGLALSFSVAKRMPLRRILLST